MEEDSFWGLIETSRALDVDGTYENLVSRVAACPMEALHLFVFRWEERRRAAFRWDIWGAFYMLNGMSSPDSFEYFRNGLILKGRAVFEAALSDPDSLAASLPFEEDVGFECYPGPDAFEVATGRPDEDQASYYSSREEAFERLKVLDSRRPYEWSQSEPAGERWDFDDEGESRRRLPRLADRFFSDLHPTWWFPSKPTS